MQEEGPPDAIGGALCGHLHILPRLSWCEDDQGRSAEDGHYLEEARVLGGKYKRFFIMLSYYYAFITLWYIMLYALCFHNTNLDTPTCHYAFMM